VPCGPVAPAGLGWFWWKGRLSPAIERGPKPAVPEPALRVCSHCLRELTTFRVPDDPFSIRVDPFYGAGVIRPSDGRPTRTFNGVAVPTPFPELPSCTPPLGIPNEKVLPRYRELDGCVQLRVNRHIGNNYVANRHGLHPIDIVFMQGSAIDQDGLPRSPFSFLPDQIPRIGPGHLGREQEGYRQPRTRHRDQAHRSHLPTPSVRPNEGWLKGFRSRRSRHSAAVRWASIGYLPPSGFRMPPAAVFLPQAPYPRIAYLMAQASACFSDLSACLFS
jgi:hypothetical protein